jgi:hypothetical protein
MTRRSVLWAAMLMTLATGSTVGGEPNAASQVGPWTMQTFMISHWGFPKDEKQLKRFAQAGFNTVIAVPEQLPQCRKYGWKALLAVSADKADTYVDDSVVWGYHLFDEPARKNVPYKKFVKKMEAFHKLDAARPAYINLNEEDDPASFIKILKPRVLSYDYYQWWAKPEPFFPLLEKFRRAALEADIPLVCWVEAVVVPSGPIPADNEVKIRHSVYSALAYGVKGIQWWAWRPYNDDAAKINTELKVLGPVLLKLRSVGVFHTSPLPKQTRRLPAESWVQSSSENLILGFFKNDEGHEFILLANRNLKAASTAVLTFSRSVLSVTMLNRKTGKWVERPFTKKGAQQTLSHELAPGDGMLLRVVREKVTKKPPR